MEIHELTAQEEAKAIMAERHEKGCLPMHTGMTEQDGTRMFAERANKNG